MVIEHSLNEDETEGKFCTGYNRDSHWCPLDNFYHDKRVSDGLRSICKSCWSEYNKSDSAKRSNKKYRQSDRGRKLGVVSSMKYQRTKRGRKFHNEAVKLYYKGHKDEILKRSSEYFKSPAGKLTSKKSVYKRRKRGFIPLICNPYPREIDIDWHHISSTSPFVIPVPRITHRCVLGAEHFEHNSQWAELLYPINNLG